MKSSVYTVSSFTKSIKQSLEKQFGTVWVQGEVSGFSRASSRHIYFTLKDDSASLRCVWFAGKQILIEPLYTRVRDTMISENTPCDEKTGEVFATDTPTRIEDLEEGGEFIVLGKLSVYAPRGEYQIVVEMIFPVGRGNLTQEFERLKKELQRRGFFSPERKRPIPVNPRKVAVVTSLQAAALVDFLVIAGKRGLSSRIRLYPSLVQGIGACEEICSAIQRANSDNWAEVIVLIRGGGSLEDLWTFNEVSVANAVFSSAIPVLAGIGHEVDFTLADLTADMRAATPTHAAEILWSSRDEILKSIVTEESHLFRLTSHFLSRHSQNLAHLGALLERLSPLRKIESHEETVKSLQKELSLHMHSLMKGKESALRESTNALQVHSPLRKIEAHEEKLARLQKELSERFSAQMEKKENTLREALQTLRMRSPENRIVLHLRELMRLTEMLPRFLEKKMRLLEEKLSLSSEALYRNFSLSVDGKLRLLEKAEALLSASNPASLLERGYAMLEDENGNIIIHAFGVKENQKIFIQLSDGVLEADIRRIHAHSPNFAHNLKGSSHGQSQE